MAWMAMVRMWRRGLVAAGAVLVLAGCGTPLATVPNQAGEPVMLLGYDPVAYVTRGQPQRGNPQIKVSLPDRTYYFASAEHKALFEREPARYEPQYGGFCASGAAFAVKLGSDPTSWVIRHGRLFIFGDVLGQTAWELDADWNIAHADRLWPEARDAGWRAQSLSRYLNKVPHYLTGAQIKAQWEAKNPGKTWPAYDPGGMMNNLFLKRPGWRAAEGFGQPALGYPQ
ncbi:MAG: YHS domain-containing (seleno)protein [Burkholderiales bacterium]